MKEREMLEKIRQSAQDMEVPEALRPDQVRNKLKDGSVKSRHVKKWNSFGKIAAAACLCICFGTGGLVYRNYANRQTEMERVQKHEQDQAAGSSQEADQDVQNPSRVREADQDTKADADTEQEAPVKKLGKMYTLASDYGEVYDVLKEAENWRMMSGGVKEEMKSAAAAEDSADELYNRGMSTADKDSSEFSTTNLQVQGVDESDYVKTDGSFLYVVQNAQIQVLDVRNRIPVTAGTIEPDLDEDTDRICEMYAADRRLTVIVQTEQTKLQEKPADGKSAIDGQQNDQEEGSPDMQVKKLAEEDVQYVNTTAVTKAVTYDITDPQKPVLKDIAVQDGWYSTSRKIGNRLYLFTNQSLGIAEWMQRDTAVTDNELKAWLPGVNGRVVSADCIYLPERGSQGLLMASIDLADHSKVLDQKLLINDYADLYVSSRSVYLYYNDYTNDAVRTRIARFALEEDGSIRARAAKTVKGSITDTFAIHENDGYLQVLTSVTSADPWENRVYVLDENMETAGKLTGLAEGEQIYSARFTGNIGYFVTYRNTDPLFTVDFSDPRKPVVIGELAVTGFSEYLHFWSDDRLLGIGYETNPDSGETIGVKLSMFDISDPAKVKEEAKLVLEGADYCNGMYDYKAVLVDEEKNLIAFTTEKYREGFQEDYHVFSYAGGKFTSRIERILVSGESFSYGNYWRSVYVGDMLYLVNAKKTITFDMKADWREIAKLKYGWRDEKSGEIAVDEGNFLPQL